jgi:hypothetical protein
MEEERGRGGKERKIKYFFFCSFFKTRQPEQNKQPGHSWKIN